MPQPNAHRMRPAVSAVDAAGLSSLSRLLDEAHALDFGPDGRETWLAGLPPAERHLAPLLREMLTEERLPRHAGFMAQMPGCEPPGGALPTDTTPAAGDAVGPYRLLRLLGRGGMAVVWLAERADGVMQRQVALKMPLRALETPQQVERFERERELLARLEHPQIARLYDAGVADDGQPYIVLEAVDGLPLGEACDRRRLDVPARIGVFLQVLAAVEHAHKHLVIHRDLKPSNVFVDAGGQVKLLDFGIAKLLSAPQEDTAPAAHPTQLTQGPLLTPRYAAPEQIDGRPVSTATDVYALGVLLYELLTGEVPHAAAQGSVAEALHAALHAEPPPPSRAAIAGPQALLRGLPQPRQLAALVAGDLDTIVMKALRRAPDERYGSVDRFADDLRAWLEHRPIAARPPSPLRRLVLFGRRHRHAAWAASAGIAAAFLLGALLSGQHALTAAQQARADAVREFMLDMVEDAEPDETQAGTEVTGRQMVAGALRRAPERFAEQPRLLGEVLSELGRIELAFGDTQSAAAPLARAQALLETHAPGDDPALNKNRVWMAQLAAASQDVPKARALAGRALAACRTPGPECAKARAYAGSLLADIALREGRLDEGLAAMRASVADHEEGFGANHSETAMAWTHLATAARNAGLLQEAGRAILQATGAASSTVLRARDRLAMQRTHAVVALDLGRIDEARELLGGLLARTTEPAERALQLRLRATAELALGEAAAARRDADAAIAAAETARAAPGADQADAERWFALQARARAASLEGDADGALADMARVLAGLTAAGYTADSEPLLRTHRLVGEMRARRGDVGGALAEIAPGIAALELAPGRLSTELGVALDLEGCLRLAGKRPGEAAALHARAADALALHLPTDHPWRERNALYRERALALATPSTDVAGRRAGLERLDRLAERYRSGFGADSIWTRLLATPSLQTSCAAGEPTGCAWIL